MQNLDGVDSTRTRTRTRTFRYKRSWPWMSARTGQAIFTIIPPPSCLKRMSYDFDPATIPGNATKQTKLAVSKWISVWQRDKSYGDNIGSRVRLTEISIDHKHHQPEKLEGKVVAEIPVTEGTLSRVSVGRVWERSPKKCRYDQLQWDPPWGMHYVFGRHASQPINMVKIYALMSLQTIAYVSFCAGMWTRRLRRPGVTQAIHAVFHAPAGLYVPFP
jgi:hypothetical protein